MKKCHSKTSLCFLILSKENYANVEIIGHFELESYECLWLAIIVSTIYPELSLSCILHKKVVNYENVSNKICYLTHR